MKIFYTFLIFSLMMANFVGVSAQALGAGCSLGTDDAPAPSAIACVLGRIIGIATLAAGGAFVAMIAYGAVKLGMATGSPEGYKGAKATWQWAVIGVFVVTGVFMIIGIVSQLFGFSVAPSAMVGAMTNAINNLIQLAINGEN